MNHREVRSHLGEYLQGDLTLAQRALFDAHIDACEVCSAELFALRRTIQLLRQLPTPEVPPHLADRVIARIEDGEGRARWWDGLLAFWNAIDPARYLPPLAAAALTSAVVIVGVRDLGWEIPGVRHEPGSAALVQPRPSEAATALRSLPDEAPASRPSASGPAPLASERAPDRSRALPATTAASGATRPDAAFEAPAFLQRPFGTRAAPPSTAGSAARSPEEDLRLALEDPYAFVTRFHALRPPEAQEAWLAAVAEHAARQEAVADVARRLRETEGDEGRALATRFEGAAQAVAYPAERR